MKSVAPRPFRCLSALLLLSTSTVAWGQARDDIVVIGTRELQAALEEIEPERSLDEDAVSSYGVGTVGEVLDELSAEMGDTGEPVLFVNGRPITDPGDIVDYPAEAIERIDVLPRGAGARLGAATDRRAYNVVLKRVFKSDIGVVRGQFATDGDWTSAGAELFLTRISGQRRLNLTFRIRDESNLLESDRGILQPAATYPYGLTGNIVADPRSGLAEIDPVLSAAAGRLVTVAGVPVGTSAPSLADFAGTAGKPHTTDLGRYRTLKPDSRTYEFSMTGNQPLNDWLSAALTGRIERTTYDSLQGLRAGLFVLPEDNPASPFTRPVAIARYFEGDGLAQRSQNWRGNLGLTLNATRGKWNLSLRGDYRYFDWRTRSQRQHISAASPIVLDGPGGPNPFADDLGPLVTLYDDESFSRNQTTSLQFSATGPVLDLPAGPLRANFNGGWRDVDQFSRTDSPFFQSRRAFGRDELSAQGSLEIPLTSREREALGSIGDVSVTLDYAATDVAGLGTVQREGYALTWQPMPRLRIQGAINRQRSVPDAQQIGDAVTVTEGVRYFDVMRGETVDVTQIFGGNPDLRGESLLTRRISATAQVLPEDRLQLNAEYLATRLRDPISSLPPASAELMAAFPERFLRDPSDRLITVDTRPLNFQRRSSEQLRWGAVFTAPLTRVPPPGTPGAAGAPRPRLQFTLSHTVNLRDEVLAREGFAAVDLLDGGAIGFGGGSVRHLLDGAVNLSDREAGFRLGATWRSGSRLNVGSAAMPGQLRFSSLAMVNLRAFADLGQVWPNEKWLKKTRISLNLANIFNVRQSVFDEAGLIPMRYQPGYRDPLGRTVEIELRRTF